MPICEAQPVVGRQHRQTTHPLVYLVARIGTFPTVFATRKPKGGVNDRRD